MEEVKEKTTTLVRSGQKLAVRGTRGVLRDVGSISSSPSPSPAVYTYYSSALSTGSGVDGGVIDSGRLNGALAVLYWCSTPPIEILFLIMSKVIR